MLSYFAAETKLNGRDQKKVGNNRWLVRAEHYRIDPVTGEAFQVTADHPDARPAICYVLHRTAVVTIIQGDFYILNTGGWYSVTTKAAINEVIPSYLCSERGEWIIGFPTYGYIEFRDGMVLNSMGRDLDHMEVTA